MKQPNALVVIAGDFNPLSTGLKPKDLTQSNNLKQIVKFQTRDTGTLDWFLTNIPAILQLCQLPKIARSDHFTILAKLITVITSSTDSHAIQKVTVRNLRDSAWRTFGPWLTNKDWLQLSSAESCKYKFHIFITEIQNEVDSYLPWKSVRIHPTDRPWTTKRIKMLIKERGQIPLPIGF